ncbi:amylo-alpha-1,6-glucosidase [Naasia sp. SYSU D00948]|uniref:amylo-alpha-1,6-glucosidase n=1 Tax=Naasia sp. SYSU D00948 TaxID=2817379 RepID=UPI001FEDDB18|nr:trehalase family glycosidase [Naasia sp. SYSU D00948]
MPYDLRHVPFSAAGSYLALSYLSGHDQVSSTVSLRTVRGGVQHRELLELHPLVAGAEASAEAEFTPERLRLRAGEGDIEVRFADPSVLRLAASGVGLLLSARAPSPYDTLVQVSNKEWRYLHFASGTTLLLRVVAGAARSESTWDGLRSPLVRIVADPGTVVEVEELRNEPELPERSDGGPDGVPGFPEWLEGAPPAPSHLAEARELAAYVTWSSLVGRSGHLRRPSMYMSKNWMVNVWSWDHCFNALALRDRLVLARDQLLTIFDHQSRHGNLPDSINDGTRTYTFTKPPVHGWALLRLLERGSVGESWLREAYPPLASWTEWWLRERVAPGRRLPHYYHGNDSGWDNSTVFAAGVPVESPELAAFLVLQTEALAIVAGKLGDDEAARRWTETSSGLQAALLDELWTGDRFLARSALTGEAVPSESLQLLLPLVLGRRLPREVFGAAVERLRTGGFLTEHGPATEAVSSPLYEPDGYWRGPIWAPSTLLLVDGLRDGGELELARGIAEGFCAMVAESGMAENFDAVTGAGLRDRAYSWTASVFLVLASDYLLPPVSD